MHGERLQIDPCLPKHWPGFTLGYRRRGSAHAATRYEITVEDPRYVCRGVTRIDLDGEQLDASGAIALADDGRAHALRVVLG